MRPFRHAVMSAHASRFARDRAQHSEAAGIDQRYSPNLVERLYEKGWRASEVQVLMAKNSEKSISLCSLVGLWSLLLGLIRTFHTVSEEEFSEVRSGLRLVASSYRWEGLARSRQAG